MFSGDRERMHWEQMVYDWFHTQKKDQSDFQI